MSGPGADHITLDRTNLLRLADLLAAAVPSGATSPQAQGYLAAVAGLRAIALEMPHLYGNEGCPVIRPLPADGGAA